MKPTIVEIGFGNWFDDLLFKRELKLILEIDSHVKKKKKPLLKQKIQMFVPHWKKKKKLNYASSSICYKLHIVHVFSLCLRSVLVS
jgi:hypothetical protein